MRRLRINISYDGSNYGGWQIQPNRDSIQSQIENALNTITNEPIRIHASGRTDAGVHARKQVAHFDIEKTITNKKLKYGLNSLLPPDIRINNVMDVPKGFHARFDVKEKEYRYFIYNGRILSPFDRQYKLLIKKKLDIPAIKEAASFLTGKHDFSAFTANARREVDSTVREITDIQIIQNGNTIVISAKSKGFLYKMVRSIAGYLIRVGLHELPSNSTAEILQSRCRSEVVKTAPAKGLFLWNVKY